MSLPLSRFAPSPKGGRPQWPGKASSTGALAWIVPVSHEVDNLARWITD